MKKLWIIIVLLAIGLLLWLLFHHRSRTHATELRPAPDFSVTDLGGQPLTLSAYRGKVVVLDFWATWCEPCKIEIPHFVEMQNRYASQGLQVIGISMDDDDKPVREFQQQYKMNYPVAIGNAKLAQAYGGILGLPITFVIDREGRIVARHIGQTAPSVFDREVEQRLR